MNTKIIETLLWLIIFFLILFILTLPQLLGLDPEPVRSAYKNIAEEQCIANGNIWDMNKSQCIYIDKDNVEDRGLYEGVRNEKDNKRSQS